MLLGNGCIFPAVMFAALRLGAVAVPISIREQTQGLAYMLAHAGAKVLVHEAELTGRLPSAADTPDLTHRIAADSSARLAHFSLMAEGTGEAPVDVDEEDAAIVGGVA